MNPICVSRLKIEFGRFKVSLRNRMSREIRRGLDSGSKLLRRVYAGACRRRRLFGCIRITYTPARGWAGQCNSEDSTIGRSALHRDLTSMVLNYFLDDGQPEARPVLLSLTYERFEKRISNGAGNAAAVVADLHFDSQGSLKDLNLNLHGTGHTRFAGVEQEIEKCPFEFPMIKPSVSVS